MKNTLYIFLICAFLISCEELFKSGADIAQDRIATVVGFNYMPDDTVSLGDTLTVEAVIVDSLDIKKLYDWGFQDTTITNNRRFISFIISDEPGSKVGGVVIRPDSSEKRILIQKRNC